MRLPRLTRQTTTILTVLLTDLDAEHYGRGLAAATGLATGTVHPVLRRLREIGALEAWWEDGEIADRERRPRRRYYKLTTDGAAEIRAAIASASRGHPERVLERRGARLARRRDADGPR